ncbi:hypothetical protein PG990_014618 [Apiospora arundinis]
MCILKYLGPMSISIFRGLAKVALSKEDDLAKAANGTQLGRPSWQPTNNLESAWPRLPPRLSAYAPAKR